MSKEVQQQFPISLPSILFDWAHGCRLHVRVDEACNSLKHAQCWSTADEVIPQAKAEAVFAHVWRL